ncbi:hypothetical protein ES703_115148 [subsurface metagenome]
MEYTSTSSLRLITSGMLLLVTTLILVRMKCSPLGVSFALRIKEIPGNLCMHLQQMIKMFSELAHLLGIRINCMFFRMLSWV